MEQLVSFVREDFEIRPLKIKDKWISPYDINLSNGDKVILCSNGDFILNGIRYLTNRELNVALKKKYGNGEEYKNIKKQIPKSQSFKIDAGYKWFDRRDLYVDDCMKELGVRFESPFKKLILQQSGWEMLDASGLSRQPDLLFINYIMNVILYYEMKLCPVLDTTNGPGNIEKIDLLTNELTNKYPNMKIISGLFCPCLLNATKIKDIASQLASKNPTYKEREILGFNSLMEIIGLPLLNDAEFIELGKSIGKELQAKSQIEDNEEIEVI